MSYFRHARVLVGFPVGDSDFLKVVSTKAGCLQHSDALSGPGPYCSACGLKMVESRCVEATEGCLRLWAKFGTFEPEYWADHLLDHLAQGPKGQTFLGCMLVSLNDPYLAEATLPPRKCSRS